MIKEIFIGISGYFNSLSLISKLKLWKYFFIPITISVLTATAIGFIAYGLSDNVGRFIAKIWIWETGKDTFSSVSNFIAGITVIAIGLILYKHIIMALSAPFMSPVSEKIETHLTGIKKHNHRKTTFAQQLARGIRINLRNLGFELLITIPLLMLKFIPGINIISTILLFSTQAYYAGFGNIDYTLERHFKYNDSIKFVKNHRGLAIGNGFVFILFLLIPIIGIILVLPLSVTAATVKTVKILEKEHVYNVSRIKPYMILEFDSYQIQPIKETDAWRICDLMLSNEDRFKNYFPGTLAQNITPELSKLFTQQKVNQFKTKKEFLFTLKVTETRQIIGLIYIKELDWNIKQGEFAYCIDYNFKGKQLITIVVKLLSAYAFAKLNIKTLQIIAHKDNKASVNVALNNNFMWQKTLLKEFTPPKSEPLDMELYEKYKV